MSEEMIQPENDQELADHELDQVAGGTLSRPASSQLKTAYNPQVFNANPVPCVQPGEYVPCIQPGVESQ